MPIPLAILGAGIFAHEAHLPAIQALGDSVSLKAIYSRSGSSAEALAEKARVALHLDSLEVYHDQGGSSHDLNALLARPDISAVIVALPINNQPEIVLRSLAAGKHVLSEKPVAKDVADGIELIKKYRDQYKNKGLIWRVAENFEAEPGYIAAAKAIRDGAIGKVLFWNLSAVNALNQDSKWYKTPWRTIPGYQGGFLLDGGVHSVAVLRTILPSPLTHLSGFASLNKDYLQPHDTINAIAKSADGSHGIFELSFAAPSASRAGGKTTVTGSDGWLEITQSQGVLKVVVRKGAEGVEEVVAEEKVCGVEKEIQSFLKAIEGNDDGLGDAHGALRDVGFIQAALNSNGALVDLNELVPAL